MLLEELLQNLLRADLTLEIADRYAEIDAYNQNKLPARSLGRTARNMGKNDLWIAATASVLGAILLTTNHDFDHLDGMYVQLAKITPSVP